MAVDNALFPGQDNYAQWVQRKNNSGMGGMGADQLGYGSYLTETQGPNAVADRQASMNSSEYKRLKAAGIPDASNPHASAMSGLQNAMPPVTPQGTGAVATAGAPPPPGNTTGMGMPSGDTTEAVGATPAAITPPVQPAGAAQPAATPAPVTAATARPRRRMVTQGSKPVQGLRAANGAGY